MKQSEPWYISQRTEALATVALTRRSDLAIRRCNDDLGLDWLVEIVRGGRTTGRLLGIQLGAQVEGLNEGSRFAPSDCFRNTPSTAFPVCGFYFTMKDDGAYWYWIAEPVLVDGRDPKLLRTSQPELRTLDRAGLDEFIEQTDRWYDALAVTLAA